MKRVSVPITTSGGGAATVYSPALAGKLGSVYIQKGTLAATTDIVITEEDTAAALLTLTNVVADGRYLVRNAASDAAGAAIAGAYDTPVIGGRIKAVIAQGGAATTGTLIYDVDDIGDTAGASALATRTFTPSPGTNNPTYYPAVIDSTDDPNLSHN